MDQVDRVREPRFMKLGNLKKLFNWSKTEAVEFSTSVEYWRSRYRQGGNSGAGSYGILAEYKAEFLNQFVEANAISSVIEFGCGDGNNLSLCKFPNYLGLDISIEVIEHNRTKFKDNLDWAFLEFDLHRNFSFMADLSLSLDVIFHLVEDEIFELYLNSLLDATSGYTVIYSSNVDQVHPAKHVRHRHFSYWIDKNRPDFYLVEVAQNPYKSDLFENDPNKSFADFYVYARR